jgi:alpha-D-ribose 1-methylphosphonate 5-triphosphate diphosphatase
VPARSASERILTNARVVGADGVFDGTVVVQGGRIAEIAKGRSAVPAAEDLSGDLLLPGLVDLHTDALERHMMPRKDVHWAPRAALLSHDANVAAAGITTVFDSLCVGEVEWHDGRDRIFRDAVTELRSVAPKNLLRADHFLHLRCEVSVEGTVALFDSYAPDPGIGPLIKLVSLMDHTPGVGQYPDIAKWKAKNARNMGLTEAEADAYIARRQETGARVSAPQRATLVERATTLGVPVASHDDRSVADIDAAASLGIGISEFPVSRVAAQAARDRGMQIIAGAPNLVRGGSHSGNIGAHELVAAELLDAFASDYVPASMLLAAWRLHDRMGVALHQSVSLMSSRPASMVGLGDRGRIEAGLRADLVQVHISDGEPHVMQVWRQGRRVA